MSEDQSPPEDIEPTRTQDQEAKSAEAEGDATRSLGSLRSQSAREPSVEAPIVPASIGDYVILSKLGQGGMGVVYEAEQQHPRRKVALKVVRGGQFVDEHRVKLFQREAETLARLKHPNIGAIYESGCTEDGQHYFVMELVDGETLQDYLKRRPKALSPEELGHRLALFRKVVDAVHYAHQRGVIHRDLKPSNIFVTEEASLEESASSASRARSGPLVPEIKILDFGLARITASDVTATTMTTEVGVIKGTLSYMSPEQARGNPNEIEVRSDVYALGVILYEMLTGSRPYDVSKKSMAEALRVICEEPPRSLRKTLNGAGRIDSDVETIVAKALDKDVERRYASAAALSEDISRFLTSQPILARPPSTVYQLRKFAARNRALVGGVVATVLVLMAGIVVSTVFGLREATQRRRAEAEASRAEAGRLAALGQNALERDPTEALAYAIASLERDDNEATRSLALRALWQGPTYFVPPEGSVGSGFHGISFSPDGQWLAAGHWGSGELELWTDDGGAPTTLVGPRGVVWKILFDPKTEYLFSSAFAMREDEESSFRIWSVAEQRLLFELDFTGAYPPNAIHVNRDLGRVITARQTDDGVTLIHSWPIEGGEPMLLGQLPLTGSRQGAWPPVDPTGTWLALRGDREVYISRLEELASTTEPRLLGLHDNPVSLGMAFSPNGGRLATGDLGGEFRIWSVSSAAQHPIRVLPSEEKAVRVVRWDPYDSRLAVAHVDARARLIDLTGPPAADPQELRGLAVQVQNLAFHPNGSWLAGTGVGGVRVWPLDGPYPFVLRGHQDRLMDLQFSRDGSWLATCSFDRTVRRWSLCGEDDDGAWRVVTSHATSPCFALAADPEGRFLVSVFDGVRRTDLEDGSSTKLPGFNNSNGDYYWGLAYRPDGRVVAAGGGTTTASERLIRLWDQETGGVTELDPGDDTWFTDLEFLPDGRLLSAGPGGLRLWTPLAGTSELLRESGVRRIDRDPAGQRVVFVELFNLTEAEPPSWGVYELDLKTGESRELPAHRGKPFDIALDPAGKRVVTGHGDGMVRVGPINGGAAHVLIGHESPVRSVAVSPDGNWVASGSDDGVVRIWPMPQGQPIHTLPHDEFLARLKSFTNARIVRDDASSTGTRLVFDAFPGWETVPAWYAPNQ